MSRKSSGDSMSLQHMARVADVTTQASLESTRRMLALCEASKDAGIQSLVMLDEQADQLDNVEAALDSVHADMQQAEDNLSDMEKCCGLCRLPWRRSDASRTSTVAWRDEENGIVICDQPRVHVGLSPLTPQGGYITRITNDAREDEMDGNLMQVNDMVATLRSMALDLSSEVSHQNSQMDRIGVKTHANRSRVNSATKITNKLLQ